MASVVQTPGAGARPTSAPRKRRSLWWLVHGWVGLKLSLFMTWVLLTGTLAVFAVEMDWLARPAMRVAPLDAPLAPWGQMVEEARRGVPGGIVTSIAAPPHAWFAAEAMAETADGERRRVYLDPYSGVLRGTGAWMSFHRFFREMHRHLLLPAKWGIPIVCSLSVLLLLSLVTGLVSYKKFWRGFTRRPRRGDPRRLAGDLHRLAGLWSLPFLLVIAVTGLWYLVESLGGDAPYDRPPELASEALPLLDGDAIDRFAASARSAHPNLRIKEVRLPAEPGDAIGFFGQADTLLVRDRVNGVWIDPASGAVIAVLKGERLSAHQRISEAADPLHFGNFGGMTTKILWFAFGLLLTGLAATGVIIYSLRLKTAAAADEAAAARTHGSVGRALRGMGLWFYPAAGLVLLSLAMFPAWLLG